MSTKRCADWCGRGCTEEEYQEAVNAGEIMAGQLGEGWGVKIWENMGWHHSAVSLSGTLQVRQMRGDGYVAFIHGAGDIGGQPGLTGRGKTAREAVDATVALTRAEIAKLEGWLEAPV